MHIFMLVIVFVIVVWFSSVEIHADIIQGSLRVISNGGNGFPGEDGQNGDNAIDLESKVTLLILMALALSIRYVVNFNMVLSIFHFQSWLRPSDFLENTDDTTTPPGGTPLYK